MFLSTYYLFCIYQSVFIRVHSRLKGFVFPITRSPDHARSQRFFPRLRGFALVLLLTLVFTHTLLFPLDVSAVTCSLSPIPYLFSVPPW